MSELERLQAALVDFNRARDWEQFHTPRDLATALSIEASEILELFLWQQDPAHIPDRQRLSEELGDAFICLCNLARRVGIDPVAAAHDKLALNARRYPVEQSRGRAVKYDQLSAHPKEDKGDGIQ